MAATTEILESYIINIRHFEQQLLSSCGQSAVRTVLYHYYGLDLTDRELSIMLGSGENGTSDFEKGLRLMGFRYKQSDSGTLNKLKTWILKGHLPIVHLVMSDGGGHYMVVTGYDKENVYLSDPATKSAVKYGIPFFLGVWKVEEAETQTRWFLIITGKGKNRINALIKKLKHIKKKLEKN